MIPTFVFGWPTGEETGDFLAVDLGTWPSTLHYWPRLSASTFAKGGTNLRVCLVTLQGNGKFEITQSKYRLSEEQKHEDGQKLFDFCAECLKTFVETNLGEGTVKEGEKLPLGFTVRIHFILLTCLISCLGPLLLLF
jgi:hexokinase